MKIQKLIAATVTASAMLAAPLASAAPANELQPMWDPGNPKHDLNNAHIVEPKSVYDNNESVTVVAENLKANTQYVVGQCAMPAERALWLFKLPGCLKDKVYATSDSNGRLVAEFQVKSDGPNAHASVPGHVGQDHLYFMPDSESNGKTVVDAELLIVEDHGKGFRGKQVADTAETFRVRM